MDKIYITTVTSRPALPRSRYRTSVSYSGGSSATQAGTSGTDGKDGVGIASIETEGASVSGGVNVVTITLTDGTATKFNVRNGYDGAAGKSAYEVAVDDGFDGTEAAWLESLKGETGARGGIGPDGKSAYEIAVKEGFEGDEREWLDSLKGDSGQPGKDGTPGTAAGFGTPTASAVFVPAGEEPTVEVEASGPDTAKVFSFRFGIPATTKDILAQLKVKPVLTAVRGLNEDEVYVQSIRVSHPLLKSSDYKAVLMVYRRRNCRVVGTRTNGDKLRMSKKGWAVALGNYRLTGHVALTASGGFEYGASFGYTQLRDFIVQRFMTDSGHTTEELFARTYEQWKSESNTERGFGLRRRARCRFGIAVRYENPAFTAALDASRELDQTTQVIWDADNNRVERYLYSDVAPLDVMLATPSGDKKRSELWFGLAER